MVIDPNYAYIDIRELKKLNGISTMEKLGRDSQSRILKLGGKDVDLRLYVGSDHACEQATRRSRMVYYVFINTDPIVCFSKKKRAMKSSVF